MRLESRSTLRLVERGGHSEVLLSGKLVGFGLSGVIDCGGRWAVARHIDAGQGETFAQTGGQRPRTKVVEILLRKPAKTSSKCDTCSAGAALMLGN